MPRWRAKSTFWCDNYIEKERNKEISSFDARASKWRYKTLVSIFVFKGIRLTKNVHKRRDTKSSLKWVWMLKRGNGKFFKGKKITL